MNKPTHNICVVENFVVDNEQKARFTNVGVAWLKETGTITCELRPNIAVSGRFVLVTPKDDQSEA